MKNSLEGLVDSKVDPDILKLAPDFIKNREQDLKQMKSAFAVRDYDTIAKICHKLKGFSSPFGFSNLEQLAQNLEAATKSKASSDIETHFHSIDKYISSKCEQLSKLNLSN